MSEDNLNPVGNPILMSKEMASCLALMLMVAGEIGLFVVPEDGGADG